MRAFVLWSIKSRSFSANKCGKQGAGQQMGQKSGKQVANNGEVTTVFLFVAHCHRFFSGSGFRKTEVQEFKSE